MSNSYTQYMSDYPLPSTLLIRTLQVHFSFVIPETKLFKAK